MKVSGVTTMHAPPPEVWAALTDPDVLARAIPGCRSFEPSGTATYRFTIAAGIASLQGVYTGQVTLSEPREPTSFVLTASGAGDPGTVSISVRIRLTGAQDGTTVLDYDADGVVGGIMAAVGQRMVTAVAQRITGDFFRSVDDQISAGHARSGADPAPVETSTVETSTVETSTVETSTVETSTVETSHGPEPGPGEQGHAELVRGVLIGSATTLAGVAISAVWRRRRR
jgi:carbon monoxide dehydrogenase subunit G